jgi:glycosyltransferase involved in cell wall biosynthesis
MDKPNISVITPVRAKREEDVTWLAKAIESVLEQTYEGWEMIIVNDSSEVSLSPIKKYITEHENIMAMKSNGAGVSNARNTAAANARCRFLLPLDHDDILPPKAMEYLVDGWTAGGKDFGVVYGNVLSFGVDFQRHMEMPNFFFGTLLRTLIMPIGSLHEKSSWAHIGGWDPNFQIGLEDWEYWIRMAINGFHGYRVEAVVYHYRRHAHGRLAHLRAHDEDFTAARAAVRAKHSEYYNGKEPQMCRGCGGGARPGSRRPTGMSAPTRVTVQASTVPAEDRAIVEYIGNRGGSFGVVGRPSGWRYQIPGGSGSLVKGPDGRPGVHKSDVRFFRAYDGGRAFRVIDK